MQRTNRVIGGTIAGILQFIVAIGLQVVLMPIILHQAGQETLGAYVIILQVIGYLILVDMGMSTAFGRSLNQASNQPERFQLLINSGFYFLVMIGLIYALACAILAFFIKDWFSLSTTIATQTQLAVISLAIWGLARFPLNIYSISLTAIQDLSIPPLLGALANALRMGLSVITVKLGLGVLGLIESTIIAEALLALSLLLRFNQLKPEYQIQFIGTQFTPIFQEIKTQAKFGLQAFWGGLAGKVILFTDNIVVGTLHGAIATSIYYNTQTPIFIAYNLVNQLTGSAVPGINELWANQEWDKLRDIFLRLQRFTLLMTIPVIVGGWFYLRVVIKIWVGEAQFAGQWMTLWLILFALMNTVSLVPQVFIYASGNIRNFTQLVTLEAGINLTLSFLLGKWLGPHGVALASTLARIPTIIYLQVKAHHDLAISWSEWQKVVLRPCLLAAIPTTTVTIFMVKYISSDSWGMIITHGSIMVFVHTLSSFIFGLSNIDRTSVIALITKKFFH